MRKPSRETLINEFKIITDTREQNPFKYPNSLVKGLPYGDYTVEYHGKTYENEIIVERKGAVSELFAASGSERDRFERELEKLAKVKYKWVLCEFDHNSMVNDQPPGTLQSSVVYGSVISWHIKYNVPFIFAQNRNNARAWVYKLFYNFVKYEILKIK